MRGGIVWGCVVCGDAMKSGVTGGNTVSNGVVEDDLLII